jgi:hypothetical protein
MARKKSRRTRRHRGGTSLVAAYSAAKREYHRAGEALRKSHGGRRRKAKHRKGR